MMAVMISGALSRWNARRGGQFVRMCNNACQISYILDDRRVGEESKSTKSRLELWPSRELQIRTLGIDRNFYDARRAWADSLSRVIRHTAAYDLRLSCAHGCLTYRLLGIVGVIISNGGLGIGRLLKRSPAETPREHHRVSLAEEVGRLL